MVGSKKFSNRSTSSKHSKPNIMMTWIEFVQHIFKNNKNKSYKSALVTAGKQWSSYKKSMGKSLKMKG